VSALSETLARELTPEALERVLRKHGGKVHYLPVWEALDRPGRNVRIKAERKGGADYLTLCRRYRLSVRHVRRIVDEAA
jgi:Mor family transcriptional regulator